MSRGLKFIASQALPLLLLLGCAPPTPGPDKQFAGTLSGASTGAAAGAVTGFQIGSGSGPGALVGAGIGAVAGGIDGAFTDAQEGNMLALAGQSKQERALAAAHEVLAEQYQRRLELHPTRDIYPADIFFFGDQSALRRSALPIVDEIARLNKLRLGWSRLVVASYVKSSEENSEYAQRLAEKRAQALGNRLVQAGLEPRRIEGRAVVVDAPVLIDPFDDPLRYSQAIELIPIDR